MEETLAEAGLNEKESKIYLALLKEKSCTASKLAKIAKINRTTAYLELENLMNLGLASYVIKNSKRFYQPASPEKLLEIIDFKRTKIKAMLPELKGLHKTVEPFKIEVFEGTEGIKTFYQDVLNNSKEFLAFGVTGKATEILEFSYPHFLKKFVKSGIKERAIANIRARKIMDSHPRNFLKIKYLPEKFKAEVTTVLYANKVAIQSLQKDNIYVVVITDKLLYESYKNYFEFMWEML
jgi:sugar-specific transcriptional regulator TrmB